MLGSGNPRDVRVATRLQPDHDKDCTTSMTAPERSVSRKDGPSIHVVRARKLLAGGAVGGLAAT